MPSFVIAVPEALSAASGDVSGIGEAIRAATAFQLTTDGHRSYIEAVDTAFGKDIDYAMLHKIYASPHAFDDERRYSPAICTGIDLRVVQGKPNLHKASTSCVELRNLSILCATTDNGKNPDWSRPTVC